MDEPDRWVVGWVGQCGDRELGHQGVAQRLATRLDGCCPPGWEAMQAPGLQLRREPTTRLLVPDVAVIRSEVLWGGAGTVAADEVLLAVEVVSPSSEMTDRITKPALYAAAASRRTGGLGWTTGSSASPSFCTGSPRETTSRTG